MRTEKSEREARLLAALYLAQEQYGWLSPEALKLVASRLRITPEKVFFTASFYSMMKLRPCGEYLIQVCEGLSCYLVGGAEPLIEYLGDRLGVEPGGTSTDGRFSLEVVQCLASCGSAPVVRVNDMQFENMSQESLTDLVERLQEGEI